MEKKELHKKVLENISSKGAAYKDVDFDKSGIVNSHYHILNSKGDLLLRFNLKKLSQAEKNPNSNFPIGCGIILAIPGVLFLSIIIIPIFIPFFSSINKVKLLASASEAKNVLVNRIKECLVSNKEKGSSIFLDASSTLNSEYFNLETIDENSCFKARAVPRNDNLTWFEIDLNNDTGEVSKTCGDSSKPGCEEGNTW